MLLILSNLDEAKTYKALEGPLSKAQVGVQVVQTMEQAFLLSAHYKAMLALGNPALASLQTLGLVPKNRTITSLRGTPIKWAIPTLLSFSPGIKEVDYKQYVDLLCDTQIALRFSKTGSMEPKMGQYVWVPDLAPVVAEAEKRLAATDGNIDLYFDTETVGLDYMNSSKHLVSLQFCFEPGSAMALHFPDLKSSTDWMMNPVNQEHLAWLLNEPRIKTSAANGKYDLLWVWAKTGIECTNFTFDTTLVGSILDENRSNGLDVHAKIYTDMGGYSDVFDKSINKSLMDLVPKETLLPYAAGDVDAGMKVKHAQREELVKDPELTRFYLNILHPAARAFEVVERGGVFVDKQAYLELEADLKTSIHQNIETAKKLLGGRIVAKHMDLDKEGGINLTKASLLKDFMFTPMGLNLKPKMYTDKSGEASTALEHLQMFSDDPVAGEFVKVLTEFSSATKTLGTYVHGFKEHLREDGRFHPSHFLFVGNRDMGEGGATTGRLSVRDPAFQCAVGCTSVYTKEGPRRLDTLVAQIERGVRVEVLTHTGEWKLAAASYRNGVRPVFKVTTKSGRSLTCTDNHPWLTEHGFMQTGKLRPGSVIFRSWHETQDVICGGQDREVDNPGGFGPIGGSKEVSLPMRVRHGSRETLNQLGWSEAEQVLWLLQEGQAKNSWTGDERKRVAHLLGLAAHEGSLLLPQGQGVRELWRSWHTGLAFVERFIRDLLLIHGGGAARKVLGEIGREWELRARKLQVGHGHRTGPEQEEFRLAGSGRGTTAFVGGRQEVQSERGDSVQEIASRVERDSSPYHASQAREAGFLEDVVVSVEALPPEETFDLTIEDSHSFVANGIVVHNTIPKHTLWGKRIRRVFSAPDGMLVLENDYSQGELKVIACIAHEDAMLHAYMNNMDLHVATSGFVAGLTYEEMMALKVSDPEKFDSLRQLGKAGNFGLIYGMGVDGFIAYAKSNYGVTLSHEEATAFRTGFFARYPRLVEYHSTYKAFAKKHGYVRSPLGRIRHLPLINSAFGEIRSKAERQAINSPVQGTLSDMMIWCIALGVKQGWHHVCPPFGMIHDAKYTYVPEDNHEFYAKREIELMQSLPFDLVGWNPQLTFTADAKAGKNMADLKGLKF